MRKTLTVLMVTVLLLLAVGIVLVATASGVRGERAYGDPHYFLIRQLIWMTVAGVVGIAASRFDYHWWRDHKYLTVMLFGAVALGLCLVFLCRPINGSHRWLSVGSLSVQPGEFAKIVTVVAMSVWLSRIGWRVRQFKMGALYPVCGLAIFAGLLMKEPDFGSTMVVGLIGGSLMFVAGTRLIYLIPMGLAGMACVLVKVLLDTNRAGRIEAWKSDIIPHQVKQALLAFQSGGLWGVGFNKSLQKYSYLPEAHTDFIYPIGGEEFGFLFSIFVIAAYVVILICGMRISMRAPDPLGRLLAFGMTFLLVFQGTWNMAVVTGCTITKGLALPFVSYGGSNLITALAAIGTLVNVGRHVDVCDESMHTQVVKDAPVPL